MSGTTTPRDDRSMGDPRDHDLVPPLPPSPSLPPPPSGDIDPAQEVDPDEVDGMLNEGGTREDVGAGRGSQLDRP